MNFNPRPPCGGRHISKIPTEELKKFQSTAPVWGPTYADNISFFDRYISIHGPRVGADGVRFHDRIHGLLISIHGPRVGADSAKTKGNKLVCISIHGPRVGADVFRHRRLCRRRISIHGPRVGADSPPAAASALPGNFNPRPPCGGRRSKSLTTALRI